MISRLQEIDFFSVPANLGEVKRVGRIRGSQGKQREYGFGQRKRREMVEFAGRAVM